jgi:hypothetical protein
MKKIYFFFAFLSLSVLTSCSTKSYTYRATDVHLKNVISNETIVDSKIDFSKKIVSTSSARKTQKDAIDEAHYLAIQQNNIDFVVDPIIEMTSDSFNNHVAKITGWGGTYVNPKTKLEVVQDLKKIDTTDVKKFDMIYGKNTKVEVKKNSFIGGNSNGKKSTWLYFIPVVGLLFLL